MNLKDREQQENRDNLEQEFQTLQKKQNQQQEEILRLQRIVRQKEEENRILNEENTCNNTDFKNQLKQQSKIGKANGVIVKVISIYCAILSLIIILSHITVLSDVCTYYEHYYTVVADTVTQLKQLLHNEVALFSYFFLFFSVFLLIIVSVFLCKALYSITKMIQATITIYRKADTLDFNAYLSLSFVFLSFIAAIYTAVYVPGIISVIGWWILYSATSITIYQYINIRLLY